jgi:hypothetical protein
MRQVERLAPPGKELGLLAYKEQYLLHAQRPVVTFGHARWRELDQEAADAAAWAAEDSAHRIVLVDSKARALCFATTTTRAVGMANRAEWFLVSGPAAPECIARGRVNAARLNKPPAAHAMQTVTEY